MVDSLVLDFEVEDLSASGMDFRLAPPDLVLVWDGVCLQPTRSGW